MVSSFDSVLIKHKNQEMLLIHLFYPVLAPSVQLSLRSRENLETLYMYYYIISYSHVPNLYPHIVHSRLTNKTFLRHIESIDKFIKLSSQTIPYICLYSEIIFEYLS